MMVLQERDIAALLICARCFIVSASQIRRVCYPDDTTGRVTRRRLTKMVHEGVLFRRRLAVVNPTDGAATPVYHLTKTGREFLASHFDDPQFLHLPIEPSQPQHLQHYVAVAETRLLLDAAVSQHADVKLHRWCHEDAILNPEEPDATKRRRLFTELSTSPKLVCVPDAAFVLEFQGQRAVCYLEQDRDTFFHDRVAARKSPGYSGLFQQQLHKQHFPETTLDHFFVVVITPTAKRRDQLQTAFTAKNKGTPAERIYRFGSFDELTPENFLFEPMFRCCHHDDRVPLVKRSG
ncbi:MAG: replication-relaxation family protein [Planctomycetaceae bacterium]|nr:replication-relaxation family protein [Planctomycetaceae bacterium]